MTFTVNFNFIDRLNTIKNSIFYSICYHENEIVGFYREHYNSKIIKMIKLNKNFNIIQDNVDTFFGEDPRIFILHHTLYIINNDFNNIHLINVYAKKIIKINLEGKNFTFMLYNNNVYVMHYIKPFILYKLDVESGELINIDVENSENKDCQYRGGTSGYKYDDNCIYGFGHKTYTKNEVLIHDIFLWIIDFSNEKPKISIFDIDQPSNSKNIIDPTSIININNKFYLITAETDYPWYPLFDGQDYITNIYEFIIKK